MFHSFYSCRGWVYDQAIPQVSRRLARRIANIVNLDTTFRSKASPVEPWQVRLKNIDPPSGILYVTDRPPRIYTNS